MAFNDTLFQLGMDLTRSSTAQEEDFRGSAHVVQEDWSGAAAECGDAEFVGQKLHIDLTGAQRLDSARVAETALRQAFELAKGRVLSADVKRMTKDGCLTGRAAFEGGYAAIEAWPATGYIAVEIVSSGGVRPEMALSALMDAFGAREAVIKRGRTPNDGARYKKAAAVTSVAAIRPRSAVKPVKAKRAA